MRAEKKIVDWETLSVHYDLMAIAGRALLV